MNIQQVRCADIVVRKRYRKDLGEISPLADSMKANGLLQPIMARADNLNLIFGARRLASAKRLKWPTIACILVQPEDMDTLVAEQDENTQRKDFTHSEKVAIAQAIIEREKEKAKERQQKHAGTAPGKPKESPRENTPGNFSQVLFDGETEQPSESPEGRAKDIAAAAVGMSRPTLEKAAEVVAAAQQDPALQEVVDKMDATGNVSGAHREMKEKTGKEPKPSRKMKRWDKAKAKNAFGAFQRACDGIGIMKKKTSLGVTVQECLEAIFTAIKGSH